MLTKALAYVNHGRWLIECPSCKTGWLVNRDTPFGFFDARGMPHTACLCGLEIIVQFPERYDAINAALAERQNIINRNWYPHESVIDLLAQTLEREEAR